MRTTPRVFTPRVETCFHYLHHRYRRKLFGMMAKLIVERSDTYKPGRSILETSKRP